MNTPIIVTEDQALHLDEFREMDFYAVKHFALPIELMMENAGLQLARVVAQHAAAGATVVVGVGPGNNGGGGLVAARRLHGWGYQVHLHVTATALKDLPQLQLTRALAAGVVDGLPASATVFVDAYLGFSQRLPLSSWYLEAIHQELVQRAEVRVALDIPTGLGANPAQPFFPATVVCALAAPKKILFSPQLNAQFYVADLGIPHAVYERFCMELTLPFATTGGLVAIELHRG